MSSAVASVTVPYIAEIKNVRETALVASADLDYWRDHLGQENLFPFNADGHAEIVITAISSRFMGLPFHELNVGVQVCDRADGSSRDGLYFMAGFNTSRVLTFCERWMFKTPYRRASVQLRTQPASFALIESGSTILSAEMSREERASERREERWEGALFLPGRTRVFYARIGGDTLISPFIPAADTLRLSPSKSHPVVQWLLDSDVRGLEWHVRESGVHARSKTYNRQQ
jgi:hypothetical protein